MAPGHVLALLFTIFEIITAQQHHNQPKSISLGSSLSPSKQPSSWSSSSGRFQFGFYQQDAGFKVGIWLVTSLENKTVWTANRDDPPVSSTATLILTRNGFILRTEKSKDKIIVSTSETASSASMLDSGEFVLYNNRSGTIWSSFQYPTDTIVGGQSLYAGNEYAGNELFSRVSETNSSTGRFRLMMQADGNLVLYRINTIDQYTEAYWASDTHGNGLNENHLFLNETGELVLLDRSMSKVTVLNPESSLNSSIIYRATLGQDGMLRLFSYYPVNDSGGYNTSVKWKKPDDLCSVRTFCGLNSFCSTNSSTKPDCHCFPGFNFINPDNKFLGCHRNFSDEEGCKRKNPAEFYKIIDKQITTLGGLAYSQLSANKQDCGNYCLFDCYCGAALYWNKTCRKFRLPLMFAVIGENKSTTLLIKSSSGKALRRPISSPFGKERVVADNKKKLTIVLAAGLGSMTFLSFLIVISSLFVYKHRVNRYEKLRRNSNLGPTQEFILQSFSYTELQQATNGFQDELGRGSFGAVYRGAISEGHKIIAVKRLENPTEEGERQLQAELAAVRRTHHRNLVRLLGFCMQSSKKLLVYEFMSKGSLENLLFDIETRPLWKERVKIVLDVARGIQYLHEECEVQIIHCNIKLRNILIDDSWNAKISNFGLAKLLMPNQTGIVAQVRGSRGYMAPEWQKNGLITLKSDVYSFGVVLLEIVCCRSNFEVHVSTADEVLLSTWVNNCFVAREFNKLIREDEKDEVDMKTLERMVKVGLLCVQDDPSLRPSIKNVILMLEGIVEIPVPAFPNP